MMSSLRMVRLVVGLLFVAVTALGAQDTVYDCPPQGTAKRANIQALNRLKNRDAIPDPTKVKKVSLTQLLTAAPPGKGPLSTNDAVEVTAYVYDVRLAGPESCNCNASDHWRRDTHIEIVTKPMDPIDKSRLFVCEVTPRFREIMKRRGVDWSQRTLRDRFLGRWTKITGWLFYDENHDDESANTSDGKHIWRGTAWEIHPITDIVVVNGPNAAMPEADAPATTRPASEPQQETTKQTETPKSTSTTQCTATTKSGKRCSRMTSAASGKCWQHE